MALQDTTPTLTIMLWREHHGCTVYEARSRQPLWAPTSRWARLSGAIAGPKGSLPLQPAQRLDGPPGIDAASASGAQPLIAGGSPRVALAPRPRRPMTPSVGSPALAQSAGQGYHRRLTEPPAHARAFSCWAWIAGVGKVVDAFGGNRSDSGPMAFRTGRRHCARRLCGGAL